MLSTRLIFPVVLGLLGAAVLLRLGFWQLDRMDWKEGVLAEIDARIVAEPVSIPASPNVEDHRFLPVKVTGEYGPQDITVLASTKQVGAIYRIIAPFRLDDGRMILVDRGFVLDELRDAPRPIGYATITGNLHWPDEIDSYTPVPDLAAGIWFARDIPKMAEALNTEPVLLVVRTSTQSGSGIMPLPVTSAGIPNDHFEYAVTWFGLCIVWLAMAGLLVWRQLHKHEG